MTQTQTQPQPPSPKSTVEEIRQRFDQDVERFSNLETGQSATIDSPLSLDLIANVAAVTTPEATALLDIGCGAGNYTLKILQRLPRLEVTLVDLSRPMLDRAEQRVAAAGASHITLHQTDIRELDLPEASFDLVVAASVFHHLRSDDEWQAVFAKVRRSLRVGGSFWIFDLVEHSSPAVHQLMWQRYGEYLQNLRDATYRAHVEAYVEHEDTPRSLMYQLDLLRASGFGKLEVLHKNSCFAAFGGVAI